MRVLLVNKFLYPKGGSEKYMFALGDLLRAKGHQIEFFGMNDPKNIVETSKEYLIGNIDFHKKSWSTLLYPFKIIYSHEARVKVRRLIKQFRPDIAHLNNYNFQITPSILYEFKKNKIPVLQTLHDPLLVCPAHLLYHIETGMICEKCKGRKYLNCLKNKCIHGSRLRSLLGTVEAYLYSKLKTYDYIHQFICPSQFLANKLIEFGVDEGKIVVIRNFISTIAENDNFRPKTYFLYFGRIAREKGILTLLEAIQALPGIRFIIAGSGPLEDRLKGITNLSWVGFKQGEELKDLICNSIATICPSEWYENSPLSVLESLGSGLPVIGSNIGGIPELIQDKFNGLLFEPGNAKDLAAKIQYLYERKECIQEYSRNCIAGSKDFSSEKYYEKVLGVYEKTISQGIIDL
jgi:Glycosyltransferase